MTYKFTDVRMFLHCPKQSEISIFVADGLQKPGLFVHLLKMAVLFIFLAFSPLQAQMEAKDVSNLVGITDSHGNVQSYKAMDVIRNFQQGFLDCTFKREDLYYLSTYISFGKIFAYWPSEEQFPPSPNNLVRKTAATAHELKDIFKTFLVADLMTKETTAFSNFTQLKALDIQKQSNKDRGLSYNFKDALTWKEAKAENDNVQKHIMGAAFLSRVAEVLVYAGNDISAKDLRTIIPEVKKSFTGSTATFAKDISDQAYDHWMHMGFDPLAVLKEAKTLVNQAKHAPLDPRIQHTDDNFYIMPQKDPTLFLAMEKLTTGNVDIWKKVKTMQEGRFKWNTAINGWAGTGYEPNDKSIGGKVETYAQQYAKRGGKALSNIGGGSTAMSSTLTTFEKRQKLHQDCDFWIAYAYSKNPSDPNPIYPFQLNDVNHLEMVMTVMTSKDTPFTSHMGIARNAAHIFDTNIPYHSSISLDLHAFAAHVMRHRNISKKYMITTPIGRMTEILKILDKKFVTLWTAPQKNEVETNGLKLFYKGKLIFSMTGEKIKNSWFGQHKHILGNLEPEKNPVHQIDEEALANLLPK